MIVGCYSLHLYCDTGGDMYGAKCPHRGFLYPQAEYTGPNERDCLKQARMDGWRFEGNERAFCPKCNNRARSAKP